MRVAPGYFATLGVPAFLGRTFGASEEAPGGDGVLVLSHRTWRTYFDGHHDVIGRVVSLTSVLTPNPAATLRQYQIVGVMPEGFDAANPQMEFWIPVVWNPQAAGAFTARLAGGATLAAATAELGSALRQLRGTDDRTSYALEPMLDGIVEPIRPALLMLMGAALCVLLVACVNVGNLVLARMNERRSEIAVRTALGAGRGRLARQLASESIIVVAVSCAVGLVVAFVALRGLTALARTMARLDLGSEPNFPRLDEVALDWSLLLVVAAASLAIGAAVGLLPALARAHPTRSMEHLRVSASTALAGFSLFRRGRTRAVLVLVEMALALVLLTGGGLMIHSFIKLSSVETGFDPTDVLTFQVALPAERYPLARLKSFADDVVARLRAVPGVTAAAHGQLPLVMLVDRFGFSRQPNAPRPPGNNPAIVRLVSRDYFKTMGIALKRGRGFGATDAAGSGRVTVINEALAAQAFAGEDPIGTRVFFGPDDRPWEVVGVAANVRLLGLDQTATAQVFVLPAQWPGDNVFPLGPYFAVRAPVDRSDLLRQVQQIVTALEPSGGVFNATTMASIVSNRISRPRLYTTLLGSFAAVAVVLALVGVYGVIAYTVSQRTREIGIRIALGAEPSRILRLVVTESLWIAAAGIAGGLAAAVALSRLLTGLVFGVEPLDVGTLAAITAAFIVLIAIAAWIPSRRATRVAPIVALRAE
jgi:putative ABC transport system permease protein